MNETGVTIQEFLEISQAVNGQFDVIVNMIAVFLTASAFIVAVIVGFFTWRQINVDKDIRKYRNEIRKQKEHFFIESKKMQDEFQDKLNEMDEWSKQKKQQLEKELEKPLEKQTRKEIKKLEKEIDGIREEVNVRKGVLSVRPRSPLNSFSARTLTFADTGPLYDNFYSNKKDDEAIVCDNCGTVYVPKSKRKESNRFDYISDYSVYNVVDLNLTGHKCPNCKHEN